MATKAERGKYSQREWDKIQGTAPKVSTSKYAGAATGSYAGVDALATAADSAHREAADSGYVASALPHILREGFRKNSDPEFDAAIVTKQNEVLGGAIEGLSKYEGIANPFQRRALAEKYQSGLSIGLNSLTSERERRQGKLEEYITKWSGLYGAEAARKQALASSADAAFSRGMSIADKNENMRRYDIEQADKAATKGTSQANKYTSRLEQIADDVRVGKYSRETAAFKIKKEFPDADPNDIYREVEDNYEQTPYSSKHFTPGKDTTPVSERNQEERQALIKKLRQQGYDDEEIQAELDLQGY